MPMFEVTLQQTFELSTKVEAANMNVAVEEARMEMRTAGVVVDEHHDVQLVADPQPTPDEEGAEPCPEKPMELDVRDLYPDIPVAPVECGSLLLS